MEYQVRAREAEFLFPRERTNRPLGVAGPAQNATRSLYRVARFASWGRRFIIGTHESLDWRPYWLRLRARFRV